MESKQKIHKRVISFMLIAFSIVYVSFYIALNAGYYEYIKRQETTFTAEQIKKFEENILNGKPIDKGFYLKDMNAEGKTNKRLGNSISNSISKCATVGLEKIFGILNNLIEE